MKHLILFFLLIVFVALTSCGKKNNTTDVFELQNELTAKWDKAMNAGDADALALLYTDDAIRMNPDEPSWVGKEIIRNGYRSMLEKNSVKGINKVADVIHAGDYAIVRGTAVYDVTPKSGWQAIHGEGKWLDIRKLQPDGSWKIISSIWNSDLPPVAASK